MQVNIIMLAIVSALMVPTLASANVEVYGKIDMAFGTTSNGIVSTTQVASQVTKIGFKGSEDLGEGLKV